MLHFQFKLRKGTGTKLITYIKSLPLKMIVSRLSLECGAKTMTQLTLTQKWDLFHAHIKW